MATLSELRELQQYPENHIMWDANPDQDSMIREIILNGNLAVNFLVWRKSLLRVCFVVLVVNATYVMFQLVSNYMQHGTYILDEVPEPGETSHVYNSVATWVDGVCSLMCTMRSQGTTIEMMGPGFCDGMCRSFADSINATGTCLGNSGETLVPTPETSMKLKFYAYEAMLQVLKFLTSSVAAVLFYKAADSWCNLKRSFNLALVGWMMVYTAPLVYSFVPWYIALRFDNSYTEEDPMVQMFQHIPKALRYRVEMGLNIYLAVFSLGFALIPSVIRAIVQCKMLVPKSGLWTPFFVILPFFAIVLQWPFFSLISNLVSRGTITITLLVVVTQQTVYTLFASYIHRADTSEKAFHLMDVHVKAVKQIMLLVALSFLIFVTVFYAEDHLKKQLSTKCQSDKASCTEHYSVYALFWEEYKLLSGIAGDGVFVGPFAGALVNFCVSYFVTFMVMTDQMMITAGGEKKVSPPPEPIAAATPTPTLARILGSSGRRGTRYWFWIAAFAGSPVKDDSSETRTRVGYLPIMPSIRSSFCRISLMALLAADMMPIMVSTGTQGT